MEIDGGYINYVSGRRQLSLDELLGDYYPLCSTYLNKLRTYVYHNSQYNAPNKLIAIRIIYVEYMRVMSEIIVYVHHTFTIPEHPTRMYMDTLFNKRKQPMKIEAPSSSY
ncbi:hypothetical protein EWB00_007452 [Schistosoma japonicum]|uniref:Uncharacterized protein n=1 Tax=Schistosoma japonicum TaxID=6182 RepID=A0A4Z2CV05_SCHJA|nr:hypothetical protein EWB00_007452 [Schistosoma japonicum]